MFHTRICPFVALLALTINTWAPLAHAAASPDAAQLARLDRLASDVAYAEDVSAIKRLQRAYGYYLDKGMWADLGELFADEAVANYPAGVFIGKESIRKHLFLNVGNGEMGQVGLGNGRLYNHMNIQPVIHIDRGGRTAKGRWRAFAYFGNFGGNATWAEGVYEMDYVKDSGVWKINTLDYHAGFAASYQTGWGATVPENSDAPGSARPALKHPPDRARDMPCEGFPAACVAPFHYGNPGTTNGGNLWPDDVMNADTANRGNANARLADLLQRSQRLADETTITNLQRTYGYYFDNAMWDQVAALFADDGSIEMDQRGIYAGKDRIRAFLGTLGPDGLEHGWLFDHIQLQTIVDVAPDGMTAKARSRSFNTTGHFEGDAQWSEGIYENTFIKQNGVWKFRSVHYYPTFITAYDKGWAVDAQPAPGQSMELPPDRPPSEVYAIYPAMHVPAFHYLNPVTGRLPQYPVTGGPSRAVSDAALAVPGRSRSGTVEIDDFAGMLHQAEQSVGRVRDWHEIENLISAYGYYLDKNLWNDLADLFAVDGAMELAQRGVYKGRERVRDFLLHVFGRGSEGPVEGRLGNHIQMQPVINVAADGSHADARIRMMQQMSFGGRPSMGGAIYEDQLVKEDGRWKFSDLHAYNTFTAGYEGGWARNPGRGMPGQSETFPPDGPPTFAFQMFPTVYPIPYRAPHPVTGLAVRAYMADREANGMPEDIAAALREIGPRIDGARTAALYTPLFAPEPYPDVTVKRDLSYGPHARHTLDIFTRDAVGTSIRPVVVFIHGGGFARGEKHAQGSPFYDNIMRLVVNEGFIGVQMNYRLAPEFMWPSGIEDVTRAINWLRSNIANYGGNPQQIFLWGHSAGAAHTADYLSHVALQNQPAHIAGAILTSGFYDLGKEVSIWKVYYGEDISTYPERSSLPGLLQTNVPLFVNDAELDPDSFRLETEQLVRERDRIGRPVTYIRLPGHSHISETYAIGSGDRSLSDPVIRFIRNTVSSQQ
ncbi:MAG: nuclear transport factor 2 family protein [Gammaproteobacteria bacterium]|nr:nuclear transport factor 2 family protein [Gammaproteobacteria bacterium]